MLNKSRPKVRREASAPVMNPANWFLASKIGDIINESRNVTAPDNKSTPLSAPVAQQKRDGSAAARRVGARGTTTQETDARGRLRQRRVPSDTVVEIEPTRSGAETRRYTTHYASLVVL
ncbi:unnamed protein product, partial [Iphiclides podalirius]